MEPKCWFLCITWRKHWSLIAVRGKKNSQPSPSTIGIYFELSGLYPRDALIENGRPGKYWEHHTDIAFAGQGVELCSLSTEARMPVFVEFHRVEMGAWCAEVVVNCAIELNIERTFKGILQLANRNWLFLLRKFQHKNSKETKNPAVAKGSFEGSKQFPHMTRL